MAHPGGPGCKLGRCVPQRAAEELLMHLRAGQPAVACLEMIVPSLRAGATSVASPGSTPPPHAAAGQPSLACGRRRRAVRRQYARAAGCRAATNPDAPINTGAAGHICRSLKSSALWHAGQIGAAGSSARTLVSSRATTQRRSAPSTAAASASTAASACGGTNSSSVACTPAAGGPLASGRSTRPPGCRIRASV